MNLEMMGSEVTENVASLLDELHEKRRWLNTVIHGLEAALASPEHRLIEMAKRTFDAEGAGRRAADGPRGGRAALTALARSVGSTPNARRKRSQAVST